jgi:glucose/arabinose dehydrogenase
MTRSPHWMTPRLMQATLTLVLTACGSAPSATAQGSSSEPRPFTVTPIASFDTPWAMSFLPGSGLPLTNMALVSERDGRLWLVDAVSGKRQAVAGVPAVKLAGQGGLGDVVPSPDFAGNRRVYLTFAEPGQGGTSGAALGYGTLVLGKGEPRLEGFRVIWRQQPKVGSDVHFSHRIAFARDGTIFLSSGERFQFDPAQDRNVDLGKIIHLTAEGQPIGGRYYTLGHRNVLGLAFASDGRLWETEMGPRGGDELNLIEQGKNYGWPLASYGSHYDGRDIPNNHAGKGFAEPKLWWNPSISPAGLIIYSGALFPEWRGDAIFGALSGQALLHADLNGSSARKADQWNMGARIREVEQGPKGEIYLLEDKGRLLRLDPVRR